MSSLSFPSLDETGIVDTKDALLKLIKDALQEDTQGIGDLTSMSVVPENQQAVAKYWAKATGVIAGLDVARLVFDQVDSSLEVEFTIEDGEWVEADGENRFHFGTVKGNARSILLGERLSLNLMQRMSGIATMTRKMVKLCERSGTKVLDTRKTAPNLRVTDKLATKLGGGTNHRYGLYDMVMIKDNHVDIAGSITKAVTDSRKFLDENGFKHIRIEIETRDLDEVREALENPVDRIMLDNFVKLNGDEGDAKNVDVSLLEQALAIIEDHDADVETEASGNVTLASIEAIADTGVGFISSGALTHSVKALDISLKTKFIQEE